MSPENSTVAGSTLVEVLLALGISCMAATGALAMLSAADYQLAKSRVESELGGLARWFQESLMAIPYTELTGYMNPGAKEGEFFQEGFFLEKTSLKFTWKLTVHLERVNENTVFESTALEMSLVWQEPNPGFPRTQNQTRTLVYPMFQRTRF